MKLFQLLFVLPILIASITNYTYCQEYNFPIKPGSNDWKKLQTYDEMIQACQIPDSILLKIPTKDLMESCLKYPLLLTFLDYHDNKFGFETMCNKFNGFHEFFKRKENQITVMLIPRSGYSFVPYIPSSQYHNRSAVKGTYSIQIATIL